MKIAIFIPTYKRPSVLAERTKNIHENTTLPHKIYFIVEASDTPTIDAVKALCEEYIINERRDCYAGCINTAYAKTTEPFIMVGADDLKFYPNWDVEAMKLMDDPNICVVGTNDLHNPFVLKGENATHYLVRRTYWDTQTGTMDKSYPALYEYDHNWTDTEHSDTAKARGVFAMAFNSKVEHLHPCWRLSQMDDTYHKGYRQVSQDQQLYIKRKQLWQK